MLILSINWTNAFIITSLGIVIVFLVLCLLVALLYGFGMIVNLLEHNNAATTEDKKHHLKVLSGAETAAIALALELYYEDIHDEESDVITLKNINHKYSPWSSKIF